MEARLCGRTWRYLSRASHLNSCLHKTGSGHSAPPGDASAKKNAMSKTPITDSVSDAAEKIGRNYSRSEHAQASRKCHAEASQEEIMFEIALNRLTPLDREQFNKEQRNTSGFVHHP